VAVASLTRTKHLIPFARLLAGAGEPIHKLLQQAKLPANCIDDPQMIVPSAAAWHFRELTARTIGLPNAAIDAIEDIKIATLGDFGLALTRAPTLYQKLKTICALALAESTAVLVEFSQRKNGDIFFQHRFQLDHESGEWQSALYVLQIQIKLVQMVVPGWSPREVWISSAATNEKLFSNERLVAIERLGVLNARFGMPCTGFLIPRYLLALSVPARYLPRGAQPGFDEQVLWAGAPGSTYALTLQQVLSNYASDRWLHIDELAEVVGSSVRTIQRRLSDEDTTYMGVLENVRSEIGAELLTSTDAKMSEIAAHLGYSNQSSFTRAFQRWAGEVPREFRRQRRNVA
jgi:AraC-like DNA-binding protein